MYTYLGSMVVMNNQCRWAFLGKIRTCSLSSYCRWLVLTHRW